MSKKDKSKFRRRLKAQLAVQMARSQAPSQSQGTMISPKPVPALPAIEREIAKTPKQETASPSPLTLVRSDLKKSALIIGSILLLIGGLYFIDQRTNLILGLADKFFTLLKITI